ncbi:MAG TPA: DUF2339 domain-containing protein, partial [Burkholderiaceae bacterium]
TEASASAIDAAASLPLPQPTAAPFDANDDSAGRAPIPVEMPASQPPAVTAAVPVSSPPPPPPAPRRDPLAPIKAWLFGGNTIVKAGIAILFIGLAFLAKYASEHVHVPIEWRLASIGGVALALLAIGWRLRTRRAQYAQVLQGGAIAVLYLTLFAAFKFYNVLAVGPAFALMVVVAALAAALAVLQDARSLAVVGALGGFATPLLVSSGGGNYIALFSYYLVLDLGIALIAWHRTWRSLNLIGFAATFLVATAWGVLDYRPDRYASSQAFLIAFFVLFVAMMLMPARRAVAAPAATSDRGDGNGLVQRVDTWVNGTLLFGLPTITFALQYGLVRNTEYGVALSALVLAAFYVLLATALRSRPRLALPFEGTLAVGTVFLSLVIPFALDARSTAGAWALEGAGLVWIGWRQARAISRVFGYVLLLLAGVAMLTGHERHGIPTQVFNAYLFSGLMAAAASLAAAYFVHRHAPRPATTADGEAIAEPLLIGWGTLWLLAIAQLHIDTFVAAPWRLAAWLAVISAIAASYVGLAMRFDWRTIALPAIGHAPLLALATAMTALWFDMTPLHHGRWWAWPLALAVHALVLWRAAPAWPQAARTTVHVLGVLVVAGLGALLGRVVTAGWGDAGSAWDWLGWLVVPAVLLMLLPRDGVAMRWPVRESKPAYQTIASAVLAAGALLWTLLANFASDGSARPLPHVPLANPLDLGIAFALVATLLWLRSPGAAALRLSPAWRAALIGAAGFVWLNAMLVRAFHHYAGVPYHVAAWSESLAVQTGITLLWSVTALVLMWIAARRAALLPVLADSARATWMVGAGLLAAVVGKLVIVDLSGTGTVTRIVSFIGVGVLMLVIGYVAPLPTRPSGGPPARQGEEPHAAA